MLAKLKSPIGCALATALFLGACLVTLVALGKKEDPYLAEVALPGSKNRLRLLSTTAGPLDYNWKPPRFENWIPRPGVSYVPPIQVKLTGLDSMTSQPGHTFLFRTVDDRGKYTNPNQTTMGFEFTESTGYVFKRYGFVDFPHWGVYALTRSCLPRRDKELTIRIEPDWNAKPFVEMKIPNPAYQEQIVEWTPEPLPATRVRGALTARIHGMTYVPSNFGEGFFSFDIRGESTSAEWSGCYFSATLEDATGNRGNDLSPFEPAWKVHARAYRGGAAEFPADLVSPRVKVTIPAPGTIVELGQVLEAGGLKILIRSVSGVGVITEQLGTFSAKSLPAPKPDEPPLQRARLSADHINGKPLMTVTTPRPLVWIEPLGISNEVHTVVRQFEADGQVKACDPNFMQTGERHIILAELNVPTGATETEIQVAINRPEPFEFVVAPPEEARTYWKERARKENESQ